MDTKIMFIVLAAVAAVIVVVITQVPTTETSYNILVGETSATKIITLTTGTQVETIKLEQAKEYSLFTAIPNGLAENFSSIVIKTTGEIQTFPEQRIVRTIPKEENINVKFEFSAPTDKTTTINFFLKNSLFDSFTEEEKQGTLEKMKESIGLGLNIEETKELENNMAVDTIEIN